MYCFGAGSQKKQAHPDFSANNFGYDQHGEYLIVKNDIPAHHYEIVDILGKGSSGQVLNRRDHQTGESLAIKIIRNQKTSSIGFWITFANGYVTFTSNSRSYMNSIPQDQEEKHHVIKMTEHFYFCNLLYIAVEHSMANESGG